MKGAIMESVNRRVFFRQAGTVAAVAGIAGIAAQSPLGIGSAIAGASSVKEADVAPHVELKSDEHLAAHVSNSKTGEISLFTGTREVVFHDRRLASRLIRAMRTA